MASVFISQWDAVVVSKVPTTLINTPGIAIARCTCRAYCDLLVLRRYWRGKDADGRRQRLLLASTGTTVRKVTEVVYSKATAAPLTVNAMPEKTRLVFAAHGEVVASMLGNGSDCESALADFSKVGVDIDALAAQRQNDGADSFIKSWNELIEATKSRSNAAPRRP